ncbi:hypothetical protein FAIPA1_100092 [Frankia sp. AiPs1]
MLSRRESPTRRPARDPYAKTARRLPGAQSRPLLSRPCRRPLPRTMSPGTNEAIQAPRTAAERPGAGDPHLVDYGRGA